MSNRLQTNKRMSRSMIMTGLALAGLITAGTVDDALASPPAACRGSAVKITGSVEPLVAGSSSSCPNPEQSAGLSKFFQWVPDAGTGDVPVGGIGVEISGAFAVAGQSVGASQSRYSANNASAGASEVTLHVLPLGLIGSSYIYTEGVASFSSANCGAVNQFSGRSFVDNLVINYQPIEAVGSTRSDRVIPGVGILHLNYESTSATTTTRRALWLETASGDVIVGESTAKC